jgi:hypothetical protein
VTKIITSPNVHAFESTRDAYDAVNSDDSIHDGDVLVVARESVVGVAVSAWPTAITPEHGAFHTLASDVSWACVGKRPENRTEWVVGDEPHVYVIPADPGTNYTAAVELGWRLLTRAETISGEGGASTSDALDRAVFEHAHNLLP